MKVDEFLVPCLAAINLGVGAVARRLENLNVILQLLLTLGQVGVAAFTVSYIWKKLKEKAK